MHRGFMEVKGYDDVIYGMLHSASPVISMKLWVLCII